MLINWRDTTMSGAKEYLAMVICVCSMPDSPRGAVGIDDRNNGDAENLGPLRQADRASQLQQRSLRTFQALMKESGLLLPRDEWVDDAGVDLSLGVLLDSRYTNLRAQVRLRATENPHVNASRALSLRVEMHNLHYFLNGPSPLSILYVEGSMLYGVEIANGTMVDETL